MYCNYIGEYVVGILDLESRTSVAYFRDIGGVLITDSSFSSISSIEELCELLEKKYAGVIFESRFSKLDGEWVPYSPKDQEQILEVFKESNQNGRDPKR